MPSLANIPCPYLALAIAWSSYQAYRGYRIQRRLGRQEFTGVERILVLCLADMVTYFLCTFSGFLALVAFYRLAWPSPPSTATTGDSVLLIFLLLYGLTGVTGKLPELLHGLKLR
jgi:hypothetical protein